MNEQSPTNIIADSSVNGITATSGSSTNIDAGKFGNARTFNGTTDLINVPDVASLRFGNALTIAVWININAAASGWREFISRGGFESGWDIVINPGTMDFRSSCLGATDNYLATGLAAGNGWHHFAITFDSIAKKIITYRDGALLETKIQSGTLCTNPGGNVIGKGQGTFYGLMDDLRIYNRALSQPEIQDIYTTVPAN